MSRTQSAAGRSGVRLLVAALVTALAPSLLSAGTVAGRVTDAATLAAAGSATVAAEGTDVRTVTDRDGTYRLGPLPAGTYTVVFSYIGYPDVRLPVTVGADGTVELDAAIGADVVELGVFVVEGSRQGQARALSQQRAAQNLSSVISSDFSGQFPDKTIADAVKRLPGVTVETDRDTGGSEGRYVTIRGLASDFNAVSINGVRVSVSNFDGVSRSVPLDVVSAKSADSITVTKALRPDQDADSIGGAVEITTRSAFDRGAREASAEFAVGLSNLLDEYEGTPYENPLLEGSVSFSDVFGDRDQFGLQVSASYRDRAFVKQRVSTANDGWLDVGSSAPRYQIDALALQEFFDDVTSLGFTSALEWKPSDDSRMRLNLAYNDRDTDRGRQRQLIWFSDEFFFQLDEGEDAATAFDFSLASDPVLTSDTYTSLETVFNRLTREVRDFHETQTNLNAALDGEVNAGDLTLAWLAGFNRGEFEGDPERDIIARFDTAFNSRNGYSITPGDPWTPAFTTSRNRNDPALFRLRSLDLGTRYITDDEFNAAVDARLAAELAGGSGFWKAGIKLRSRARDYDNVARLYNRNNSWTLAGFSGQPDIGSLVADYGATSSVDGTYDYGIFIDPALTRTAARTLISRGLLTEAASNAVNDVLLDYEAREDIASAYALGQFTYGAVTILAGARIEASQVEFDTFRATTDIDGDTTVAPFSDDNDQVHVLPALHIRWDAAPNLVLRAAITQSIARPTFADLNPETRLSIEDESISRGNIDLDDVESLNLDVSAEYYLGTVGAITAGVFYKDLKNNIYAPDGLSELVDGVRYSLSEPRNAEGGTVLGFEVGFEAPFTFLPAPLDGLGAFVNYTHVNSEVDLGTGFPALAGIDIPLFGQVDETLNAGLFYDSSSFRARLAFLYRGEALIADGLNVNDYALSRFDGPSMTVDFTASYRFLRNWTIFVEASNLFDEPAQAYNGRDDLRLDYNEHTDWSAQLGLRWSL